MRRRDRLEVTYEVLDAINNEPGIRITDIMYATKTCHKTLVECLQILVDTGCVTETLISPESKRPGKEYAINSTGVDSLRHLRINPLMPWNRKT